MNKEDAIRILETNIHKKMVIQWFKKELFYLIIPFAVGNFIGILTPTLELTVVKSGIQLANIIPPIFTATITSISILIGFFSVTAYNFHQWYQRLKDKCGENEVIINNALKNKKQHKQELELDLGRENFVADVSIIKDQFSAKIEALDSDIKNLEESKELIDANADASAHCQEHMTKFMVTFLTVGFLLIASMTMFFIFTEALVAVFYFILCSLFSLATMFLGLKIFLSEFMLSTRHKERY